VKAHDGTDIALTIIIIIIIIIIVVVVVVRDERDRASKTIVRRTGKTR